MRINLVTGFNAEPAGFVGSAQVCWDFSQFMVMSYRGKSHLSISPSANFLLLLELSHLEP